MQYGKLINNKLVLAGSAANDLYNRNSEQAIKDDFYPIDLFEKVPEGYYREGFTLIDGIIKPKYEKLINEESYSGKRLKEYPPIEEQLDMIYWDKIYGTNLWLEKINSIKQKYPKEE